MEPSEGAFDVHLVPKLRLGNALVCEALLRRRGSTWRASSAAARGSRASKTRARPSGSLVTRAKTEFRLTHPLPKRCANFGSEREIIALPLLVRTPFGRLRTEWLQRLTVRSVKFIRWLPAPLFLQLHHEPAIAALRHLDATL